MKKIAIFLIASIFLVGCGASLDDYIDPRPTVPTIHSCYMCGSDEVYVNNYRWGFWIECENCHFKTGNFESLKDLIDRWNDIGESK